MVVWDAKGDFNSLHYGMELYCIARRFMAEEESP